MNDRAIDQEREIVGTCFQDSFGMLYKVTSQAYMAGSQVKAYVCQELGEPYDLIIWKHSDLMECLGIVQPEQEETYSEADQEKCEASEGEKFQSIALNNFLDNNDLYFKLELLQSVESWVTEPMLECMALSLDFEIGEGSREEKVEALQHFLQTRLKYETRRRE